MAPLLHLVSHQDLVKLGLPELLRSAQNIKRKVLHTRGRGRWPETLQGCVVASLFYEASTRTRLSFESAVLRMGGKLIGTENAKEFSSVTKGESLADTIRIISMYADAIILRHSEEGSAHEATLHSSVPVINAGDGTGEHPTQAFLDFFTIWETFESDVQLTVAGDLKNGRTIHSLLMLAAEVAHTELGIIRRVHCVAPENLALPTKIRDMLIETGIEVEEFSNLLGDGVHGTDVLYLTRTQKERGSDMADPTTFSLTEQVVAGLPQGAIVMHPLPRNAELPGWFDTDPRASYFEEQARNGLFTRAALLERLIPEK